MWIASGLLLIIWCCDVIISQQTNAVPPGHCANYLNRYTSQEQCVYSFIVPKKQSDECPGLKSQMMELQEAVKALQKEQEDAKTERKLLIQSKQDNMRMGQMDANLNECNRVKDSLSSQRDRLIEEKAQLEMTLRQKTVDLEDTRTLLLELQDRYMPLMRNHTQLEKQYGNVRQDLTNLLNAHNKTLVDFNKLKAQRESCVDCNKHLASCAQIKQMGYKKSGQAMIDPDAEGPLKPFLVYCDMDSDPSTGITVIDHTYQDETVVNGCDTPGCVSKVVQYKGASLQQVNALVNISLACEQHIRYNCYDSKLLKDGTGWWVSGKGERMTYWGGADPGSEKCECGMTNTCFDPNEVCNCDADNERWLWDEGTLNDRSTLPVSELRFGDVNQLSGEKGNFTLGALKCKWSPSQAVPSCDALAKAGVRDNGVFWMTNQAGEEVPPYRVACDFTRNNQGTKVSSKTVNPNVYVFTSCGVNNQRMGPTEEQCNTSYTGTNVAVKAVNGIQKWIVPKTGRYQITAKGPSGYHVNKDEAGRGATLIGDVELESGIEMRILVGQKGHLHAGAGGTFVIKMHNQYTIKALLVAGAGGSSRAVRGDRAITDASKNEDGKASSKVGNNFGAAGIQGKGAEKGGATNGPNTSGGGAGFKTDGVKSSDLRFKDITGTPKPAKAYDTPQHEKVETGGLGGTYTYVGSKTTVLDGGFGGGGSASKTGPGGAGGYSGGGGGPPSGHSGGGGSFSDNSLVSNYVVTIDNLGDGGVVIEFLEPDSEAR